MDGLEALILGLIQGLTEYLPVSSSGHLAIGAALFGIEGEDNLTFTIAVHIATVLSTLVILRKEIDWIFRGLVKFRMNEETDYVVNILVSMIPIGIVGVFFKDNVAFDSLSLGFFLLCPPPKEAAYQQEGCFYHRSGSGMCGDAGIVPFRKYDRYRPNVRQ